MTAVWLVSWGGAGLLLSSIFIVFTLGALIFSLVLLMIQMERRRTAGLAARTGRLTSRAP